VLSATSIRLGGLVALASAVVVIIADLLRLIVLHAVFQAHGINPSVLTYIIVETPPTSETATTGLYAFDTALYLLATLLLLFGLICRYASQSEEAGVLGLVGFVVAFSGTALVLGSNWTDLFAVPSVAMGAPELLDAEQAAGPVTLGYILSGGLFAVGLLVFGVSTLRARVYPRAAAITLIIGAVFFLLPVPLNNLLSAVGVAWMGFILFTGRNTSVEQPSRVR
jgi:hypothetical protein